MLNPKMKDYEGISKINPDAHYENQIRLTIKIKKNEK